MSTLLPEPALSAPEQPSMLGGAPPGAPAERAPPQSAFHAELARTANAEGQQEGGSGQRAPAGVDGRVGEPRNVPGTAVGRTEPAGGHARRSPRDRREPHEKSPAPAGTQNADPAAVGNGTPANVDLEGPTVRGIAPFADSANVPAPGATAQLSTAADAQSTPAGQGATAADRPNTQASQPSTADATKADPAGLTQDAATHPTLTGAGNEVSSPPAVAVTPADALSGAPTVDAPTPDPATAGSGPASTSGESEPGAPLPTGSARGTSSPDSGSQGTDGSRAAGDAELPFDTAAAGPPAELPMDELPRRGTSMASSPTPARNSALPAPASVDLWNPAETGGVSAHANAHPTARTPGPRGVGSSGLPGELDEAESTPAGAASNNQAGPLAGLADASVQAQPAATSAGGTLPGYGVGLQQAIESIQITIELAAREGLSQARIALQPEELGEIRIHLTQTAAGLIARVTAEAPAAAQALAQGHAELRQSLSSMGLSLARLHIGHHEQASANGSRQEGERNGQHPDGGSLSGAGGTSAGMTSEIPNPDDPAAGLTGEQQPPEASPLADGALLDVLV